MLKWIVRIFGIIVLIILILGVIAYFNLKSTEPPEAEYAVQAYHQDGEFKIPTRIYYAERIKILEGNAVLFNYWSYDGKRYHNHSGNKTVSPPYDIIKRGVR